MLHLFVTESAPSLGASGLSRDEIEQLRSPKRPGSHRTDRRPAREVATLDGITHIETAPVARLVKVHATLTAPA